MSAADESCTGGCKGAGPLGELREQDRFLPIAVVDRIMKSVDNGSTPYKVRYLWQFRVDFGRDQRESWKRRFVWNGCVLIRFFLFTKRGL